MEKENTIKIINTNLIFSIQKITLFIILAAIIPAFVHNQWITGPLVNALLFLSVIYCGISGAILVGMIPSVIALSVGLLPAPLAVAVPYIMVSNAILVLVFAAFCGRSRSIKKYWIGISIASLLKFGFLFMAASTVVKLASPQIAPKIAVMLGWPQLATAAAGGGIAFVIYLFYSN